MNTENKTNNDDLLHPKVLRCIKLLKANDIPIDMAAYTLFTYKKLE